MDVTTKLDRVTCWCGTPFMAPERLVDSARNHGHTLYCPHGHTITWKETELDRVRRDRDRLKQDAARLVDERLAADARTARAERETKRMKKRAAAGTCPCCQRSFSNMATHMKRQHPEYVKETGANVIPIKIGAQ